MDPRRQLARIGRRYQKNLRLAVLFRQVVNPSPKNGLHSCGSTRNVQPRARNIASRMAAEENIRYAFPQTTKIIQFPATQTYSSAFRSQRTQRLTFQWEKVTALISDLLQTSTGIGLEPQTKQIFNDGKFQILAWRAKKNMEVKENIALWKSQRRRRKIHSSDRSRKNPWKFQCMVLGRRKNPTDAGHHEKTVLHRRPRQ